MITEPPILLSELNWYICYLTKPCHFFEGSAPNPFFCVLSQLVSWSAQPLEPPSETYVSALHDMWLMNERKF